MNYYFLNFSRTTRQVAPSFVIKPRRQFVDGGENAKFKAAVEGSPEPEVEWKKDGETLMDGVKYKVSDVIILSWENNHYTD